MLQAPITITQTILLPPEKVWAYWTTPVHICNWNNASPDWHTPYAENNLFVGGNFKSRMEAKDGSFGFDFEGFYDEVVIFKRISYHLADARKVEIVFEAFEDSTIVTEIFDPENENSLELQRAGWQSILDNFKRYAESNS